MFGAKSVQFVRFDGVPGSNRSKLGVSWPPLAFGLNMLHSRPPGPLPRPDMPQMSSMVASDHVLSAGVNGRCRSQRRPPLTVRAGVTRHESCTNAAKLV